MAAPQDIFTLIANNDALQAIVGLAQQRIAAIPFVETSTDALGDMTLDFNSLSSVCVTDINGRADLKEQTVQVEYLRADQRLKIPQALGMSIAGNIPGRAPRQQTLFNRYWKLTGASYSDLKALVVANTTLTTLRAAIEARATEVGDVRRSDWDEDAWYTLADGQLDSPGNIAVVFSAISRAMQSNCDVRDYGRLNDPDMTVGDGAWSDIADTPRSRLRSKLKAHTIQCISAMNLQACTGFPMAAIVRAYGLSVGLLHNANSKMNPEFMFSAAMPTLADVNTIVEFERSATFGMFDMACNLLAMFGLFHLSKDHTFKTGETNMERIGDSYLGTVRTMVANPIIDSFKTHREVMVRTAAHPFGLAQTYWLARIMFRFGLLAPALSKRIDVTPPPVQRVMITLAAYGEWSNLPSSVLVNNYFANEIAILQQASAAIKANPPAYSGLHALYGIATMSTLSAEVIAAVEKIIPCVNGYATSQHVTDNQNRDGIALALSMNNVIRDKKALVTLWTNMWDKHVNELDTKGIAAFTAAVMADGYGGLGGGAQAPQAGPS